MQAGFLFRKGQVENFMVSFKVNFDSPGGEEGDSESCSNFNMDVLKLLLLFVWLFSSGEFEGMVML